MKHLTLLLAGTALWLAACAPEETAPEPEATTPPAAEEPMAEPTPEPTATEMIEPAVLTAPGRTDDDMARDEDRKPVETLDFIGVEPGMTVLELEAGGGYFTPMLAYAVGPEGSVYMQNPEIFRNYFDGNERPPRFDDLPDQVEYLESEFDDLSALEDGSVDIVTWLQGPHEIWFQPDGADEQLAEPTATFAEIVRVLKPGGELIALDHSAPEGTDTSSGGDTHRIDPAVIDQLATEAGLEKTEESQLFDNPDDDMTTNVFEPEIRGKTDQFLIRYVKP
tara:strand:+ start:9305 stop:10141 length:837 start_codon:yes stop_codon:yes gene_type:complete